MAMNDDPWRLGFARRSVHRRGWMFILSVEKFQVTERSSVTTEDRGVKLQKVLRRPTETYGVHR